MERGEAASKTGRRHIPTRVFKQAIRLTKQADKIQAALNGINPLNIGKKREEAIELLQKFFPDMEDFETKVRRYKKEFERLENENADLAKKVNAAKPKIGDRISNGNLLNEVQSLRKFYDAVPEDIRREIEAGFRQPHKNDRGIDR